MSIVTAEFSVASDAFVLGQILQDGEDVQIDLTHFVPIETALVPYFWVETSDFEGFETTVRADERVASLTALDGGSNKTLYQIEWATEIDGLLAALQEHDLIVEEATGTAESWRFRIRGSDHGNLSSFQQTCHEHDVPIEVHRVWNPNESDLDRYGLSDKQRKAVELAFTDGYFAVPRETTLGELGQTVGITGQSFARRLARGLQSLIAETLLSNSPR
ncbi:bacterio-opsin activator domain-containing protein [Haladaptatus halobius]|uniref:bacterio-opsin activator domain-containing protein n=1 Tax=Haladaptatus halobius TaxID=2884875 RepID=UPI001D0AEA5F|nr:bacterio-opsin activator domain-containing protein [Haladaptatus halobius]